MRYFPLPNFCWLFTRYAFLIDEQRVSFVSWKRGTFIKLCEFGNDVQGQSDLVAFLKQADTKYAGKIVNVCVSLIGEDYRFEKAAHLSGKYKSDMIKRKSQQLFRGVTYYGYQGQGREETGRRLDLILFCGILSNEKIQPWTRILQRGLMHIGGVHLSSMLSATLLNSIPGAKQDDDCVVSFVADEGTIRHNFFIGGGLRFSRMSVVPSNQAEDVLASVRGEVEKTAAYLASLKMMKPGQKIKVYLLCSDDLMASLQRLTAESDAAQNVLVRCISSQQHSQANGIKRPMTEFGRDYSTVMHQMCRSLFLPFDTLAPWNLVRYSAFRALALVACTGIAVWSVLNAAGSSLDMSAAYFNYSEDNANLVDDIALVRSDYEQQREQFQEPPSSLENMEAVVQLLDQTVVERINPGKMMRYVGELLSQNSYIEVNGFVWYLANDPDGEPLQLAFASGLDVYQVIELKGEANPDSNPELAVVAFEDMLDKIETRPDMSVIINSQPILVEAGGVLTGDLDVETDVRSQLNDYISRDFDIQIIWDPIGLTRARAEAAEEGAAS